MKWLFLPFILFFVNNVFCQSELTNPSFEDVLSLYSVNSPVISPDGKMILFQKRSTDWANNRYDTEIWLAVDGQSPFQLTFTQDGNSNQPGWSPDGEWISFIAKRGEKSQLFVMRAKGGEAFAITHEDRSVNDYEWSPLGDRIAFTMAEKETDEDEAEEDKYGEFEVDDEEYKRRKLYLIDFKPDASNPDNFPCDKKDTTVQCVEWPKSIGLTDTLNIHINNFDWSPDGTMIAFTHRPKPLINTFHQTDISYIHLDSGKINRIIANPSSDNFYDWSPDSKSIVFGTQLSDTTSNYYLNTKLFKINIDGTGAIQLAKGFDENLNNVRWTKRGILATALQRTQRPLFFINPELGAYKIINQGILDRIYSFSITEDGNMLACSGNTNSSISDIYKLDLDKGDVSQVSTTNHQIEKWNTMDCEVIQWKSKDDAMIEGVLHKPKDYNKRKRYPLMVIIHGGPTGIDVPAPVLSYVYPANQWVNEGYVILRVNYRGSAGYGEAFRSLNVRNLGVGDAWDVISGVEYLHRLGIADTTRMGCMGWSQGGYISAFLTTNTSMFDAISVGAGISNWMTYYVNTDIHPFTRQYLKGTPWSDPEIYAKTSPMTNINQASTPTLIQHGEFDRRVPIPNAYELVQGLRDVGVESKLIVYKGFGHGITKPKERLAAMKHNYDWFKQYVK